MSGALRQGMVPSPSIGQQPGMMLANGFMPNPGHMGPQQGLGQGPLGLPQNMPQNPPMSMLGVPPTGTGLRQAFSMQGSQMPQSLQQQQRMMIPRQGPQLNPTSANPSAAHIPGGMAFTPNMMQGAAQGNAVRRSQSQPQMNQLGGIPQSAPGNMTMNQPNALRQLGAQPPNQQQHLQPQMRLPQRYIPPGNMDLMAMRHQSAATVMQSNMGVRQGPNQGHGQVMSSLTQPSNGQGPGLQPQHHQNPFPNGAMPNQPSNTPRPNSTGPSHNPANRRPDESNTAAMMGFGAQFPNNNMRVVPSPIPFFGSAGSPPTQLPDMRHSSPSGMNPAQGGNPASKGGFFLTPAQAQQGGGDMAPPLDDFSPNFTMPPPIQRPPSHATNSHPHHSLPPTPQTPSMSNPQQQRRSQTPQQQPPVPMMMDQMAQGPSQPQRPLSQASGSAVNAGPSQTGGRPPSRQSQPQTVFSQGLTAAGRIQQPQQPGQGGPPGSHHQQQHPSGVPIAPRPSVTNTTSQGASTSMPPPTNVPHPQNTQQQQQHHHPHPQPQQPQPPGTVPSAPPQSSQAPPTLPMPATAGQALLRLVEFSGLLALENPQKLNLAFWNEMIKEFFTPKAVMKLTLWKENQRQEAKPFEVGVPILPRFFLVTAQSGVKTMSLSLDGTRERVLESGVTILECDGAIWTYKYNNGYVVTLRGPLSMHVVVTATHPPGSINPKTGGPFSFKFEQFIFDANNYDKYIASECILGSRLMGVPSLPPPTSMAIQPMSSSMIGVRNDEMRNWEEPRVMIEHGSIPGEPVNAFGIPQATMRCLELAESVTAMVELISYSSVTESGPRDALKSFADKLRESGAVLPVPPPPPPAQSTSQWPTTAVNPLYSFSLPASTNTLYSSASPSLTHPSASAQSTSSPSNTGPSATNSPEKQPKAIPAIPQQGQMASGPASSPAISNASNTPSIGNTSLKRKQTGDTASPIMSDQQNKRNARKRTRTGTNG